MRQWARPLLVALVAIVIISSGLLVTVKAVIGGLDTTFSTDGRQTTDFGPTTVGESIAVQTDGKIVVVGLINNTSGNDFALTRYTSAGILDTTFSTDGKQTTDFGGGDDAFAVAIQTDGKIVVAGTTTVGSTKDFAVARYTSNGTLDTTFSTDGKVTTSFGNSDNAYAIAIQANGRIVVAGDTANSTSNADFAVARYNTNGTLDTTFSTDGKQTTGFGGFDSAHGVAIQANAKIVVAGVRDFFGSPDVVLARYTGTGSLDTTFSTDGKQPVNFGSDSVGSNVAIQSDGKIVVVGGVRVTATDTNFALARYNGNGSLDDGSVNDSTPNDSFGTGGHVTTDFFGSQDIPSAVAIQTNGKIVVGGEASHSNDTDTDFAVARYTTDGSLDNTFHNDGRQTVGFTSGSVDSAKDLAIQSDGKIVLAGLTIKSTGIDFALIRLIGD